MKRKRKSKGADGHLRPLLSPRARPRDAGVTFSLRLTAQELEMLREEAERERLPVSDLIRRRALSPARTNTGPDVEEMSRESRVVRNRSVG